jgi:hypothetical protein
MRSLWVTIQVPTKDIRYIKEGQKANISAELAPNEIFEGTVTEIDRTPLTIEISGTEVPAYRVKVIVDREYPSVKLGDFATVVLEPLS